LKAKFWASFILIFPSRNSFVFENFTIWPLSLSHSNTSAISWKIACTLNTVFQGRNIFDCTGTLQNLIRTISSIFSHPAPFGHAIIKQVQSETQSAFSWIHEISPHFLIQERAQVSSHDTCLSKARSLHPYSQVPGLGVPKACSA